MADAQALVRELQASPRAKANNVVLLLAALGTSSHEATIRTIINGLKPFFVDAGLDGTLIAADSSSQGAGGDAVTVYRAWLSRQYATFTQALLTIAASASHTPSSQVTATSALMECVRAEAGPGVFSGLLHARLLTALCTSPGTHPEPLSLLITKHLRYADVRYFTLWTIKALATQHAPVAESAARTAGQKRLRPGSVEEDADPSMAGYAAETLRGVALPDLFRSLYDLLVALPPSLAGCMGGTSTADARADGDVSGLASWCGAAEAGVVEAKADKNESAKQRRKRKASQGSAAGRGPDTQRAAAWANAKAQKRMYSGAWLALLGLPIPPELLNRVLLAVQETAIPNMLHPALLSDFLTHCLDQGGMTGMLALHGIFQLVAHHGLEYPAFYTRLYGLLTVDAFHSKHRAQFFALVDVFLGSPLIPAYTVAAVVKRLARHALRAPPGGALLAIAFIHNLIRRHPSLMVLLHNPRASLGAGDGADPYREDEPEPAKTQALDSSLWEVEALRNHACPHVATLCGVLDRDLADRVKTSEVDLGPLLTTSYASLFNQEVTRRIKQVPIAFYAQAPTSLLGPQWAAEMEGWDADWGRAE